MKRAHEAARPLVSCARIVSEKRADWPADLIADTIQRDMVSRETALCGGRQLTKSCFDVRSRSPVSVPLQSSNWTPQFISEMEEKDCMEVRTISRGLDDSRWFLFSLRIVHGGEASLFSSPSLCGLS